MTNKTFFHQKKHHFKETSTISITDLLPGAAKTHNQFLMSDVKEVVSATGCFQKLTSEFGKIEEVKSNLFDQLEPDEEFIVQDYRLIKQKKSDEPEVKFQNTLLK